jgi:dihydroneopterin aldolase
MLKLKNLRLKTIIGVYEWEQNIQRDIIINMTIDSEDESDSRDELISVIDYEDLTNIIKDIVKNNRFKLVESLINKIIDEVRQKYQNINKLFLEVDKLGAVEDLESFSVAKEWNKNIL